MPRKPRQQPPPAPSTTAIDGRDARGRFAPGNGFSKGNPHGRRVAELRSALFAKIGPAELGEMIDALMAKARSGDTAACKILLQYTLGDPLPIDLVERLDELERALSYANGAARCGEN